MQHPNVLEMLQMVLGGQERAREREKKREREREREREMQVQFATG